MDYQKHVVYEFGPFRLDATERLLFRDGQPVTLAPKAIETLMILIQNHGHLVEKDHLLRTVWPDTFVEEGSLTRNVSVLRKVFGEEPFGHKYIDTVPKRGYRFIAPVTELVDQELGVAGEKGTQVVTKTASRQNGTIACHWKTYRTFVGASVLFVGVAVAFSYFWIADQEKVPQARLHRSVAVLPFKPISKDSADAYLGLGIADALITRLGTLEQIKVRPTSAIYKYNVSTQDPIAAGRKLGVDSVLDGRFQRWGDRIRVTVQLVSLGDAAPVWTAKFDEKFTDLFALQDSISEQVARALTLKLSDNEQRGLKKHYTENTEAYQAYLKGRYFLDKRTVDASKKAIEHFQRAIQVDPRYALAYAGLSDCYQQLAVTTIGAVSSKEAFPKAKEAALKALSIDDSLAEAYTSLAHARMHYDWEWAPAEKDFKRALQLKPNYPTAHQWYGLYLLAMGRTDEALAELSKALELDPLSLFINLNAGWAHYFAREHDRAIEHLHKTIDMDPNFPLAHLWLARVYAEKAMFKEALGELRKAESLTGKSPAVLAELGYVHAVSGNKDRALKIINQLGALSKRQYVQSMYTAKIYIGLGDKDQAFRWLKQAVEERSSFMIFIKVQPVFDRLRSDPRFAGLLRRMRLPT